MQEKTNNSTVAYIIVIVFAVIIAGLAIFFTINSIKTTNKQAIDAVTDLKNISDAKVSQQLSLVTGNGTSQVTTNEVPQEIRIYETRIYVGDKTIEESSSEQGSPTVIIKKNDDGTTEISTADENKKIPNSELSDTSSVTKKDMVVIQGDNVYIISRGDTLTSISAHYGVSVDEIAKYNQISDVNMIYADSALRIPNKETDK